MRVAFVGTSAFAVPSLQGLVASGHEVVQCVTQPDRPQGRGLVARPSPVKTAARALGVPVDDATSLPELVAPLRRLAPEVGVVISYGRLVPASLLDVPRQGMFGVHPSLLPRYRGASPIASAILNGDATTGVTVFRLNDRMDAGDIAVQRSMAIAPRETAEQLAERLAVAGAALLIDALDRLAHGQLACQPQEERLATVTKKLTKAQGRIDWRMPADTLERWVRAAVPWPGAYTTWQGRILKLWDATSTARPSTSAAVAPGDILAVSPEGIVAAAGDGALTIHALQIEGRRRMTAAEFLAGHGIQIGDRVGAG